VNWVGIFLTSIYSSNLGGAVGLTDLGALSHTWSLGVEEQFYLLWPFILIIMLSSARRSPARLVAITVSSLLFFTVLRFVLGVVGGAGDMVRIIGVLDIRGDSLLAGGLVAILLAYYPVTPRIRARLLYCLRLILPAALSISILFVIVASGSWPLLKFGGFTFVALSVAMLIAYMMLCPEGLSARLLSWRPLARLGTVSYGIYLWHAPIFVLLPLPLPHDWLALQNWPVQMARIVLTSVCVILSYRFVERPALQLKARFSSSQQAAPTTPLQVRGRTVQPILEALDE
jgi:peptidoglycan/LPS O-acetylase OafA/YrhL